MPTNTVNLNLVKPSENEYFDINTINTNSDKIDIGYSENKAAIEKIDSDLSLLKAHNHKNMSVEFLGDIVAFTKNFNSLTQQGKYTISSSSLSTDSYSNYPSGLSSAYGMIIVENRLGGAVDPSNYNYQTLYLNTGTIYKRIKFNSTWSAWEKVIRASEATFSETITAPSNKHFFSGTLGEGGLDMKNSSIFGVGSIIFNDPSENADESIMFPKTGTNVNSTNIADYDTIKALDGKFYFSGNAIQVDGVTITQGKRIFVQASTPTALSVGDIWFDI